MLDRGSVERPEIRRGLTQQRSFCRSTCVLANDKPGYKNGNGFLILQVTVPSIVLPGC